MERSEIAALLGLISARDGRKVGEVEVEAWFEDIGRWDLATAREAVHRHYTHTSEFLRPWDLIRAIRAIRGERLDAHGPIIPPLELADDPPAEMAWIRTRREAIASGRLPTVAPVDTGMRPIPELAGRIRELSSAHAIPARNGAREAGSEMPDEAIDPQRASSLEAERRNQLDQIERRLAATESEAETNA